MEVRQNGSGQRTAMAKGGEEAGQAQGTVALHEEGSFPDCGHSISVIGDVLRGKNASLKSKNFTVFKKSFF